MSAPHSELKGKVAIVTGASRGIGAAIAEHLASKGASVIVNYSNSDEKAKSLVNSINQKGGKATAIKADVSKSSEIVRLFAETINEFGGVDIVVNNAAILIPKPIAETTDEEIERVLEVNFKGVFYSLREAAKHIREGGRIINISSTGTATSVPSGGIYVATKGAVEELSKTAALEFANKNVTVNVVSPGYTKTDMLPESYFGPGAQLSPFKRLGEPSDIAEVVTFLATEGSRWITGQNIRVNGGTQML